MACHHHHPDKQRRQLLKGTMAALLVTLYWPTQGLSIAQATPSISEKRFLWLSRRLTGQKRLDQRLMRSLLKALASEPWGLEHLQRVLDKLAPEPLNRRLIQQPVDLEKLDDAERWFVQHLITSWLTGIYFHQRGNQTLSYRYALMYDGLQDIRPVPGSCQQPFGFWQRPP